MNKVQKFVAKLFKIETEINNHYYNDPLKCQDSGSGLGIESAKSIVISTLNSAKKGAEISIGLNKTANEVVSTPLNVSLIDSINSTKYKTEIVIVINEV